MAHQVDKIMATPEYKIAKNVPFPGLEGIVFECMKGKVPDYKVHHGQSILYQVVVDEALRFQPTDPRLPVRGDSAFETDILVTRDRDPKTPLVVIEVKQVSRHMMSSPTRRRLPSTKTSIHIFVTV
jgi:hypothetical protein